MSEIIIRNVDDEMLRLMESRARAHSREVSEEMRVILRESLGLSETGDIRNGPPPGMGMGTWMRSLVPPEHRGDDLFVERAGSHRLAPHFD